MHLYAQEYTYFEKRGIIEYKEEMYDFAQENLERAVEKNPQAFRSYAYLGHLALKDGKHKQALNYYTKSIEIREAQPDVHYHAGTIYDYLMRYDKALDSFTSALEHNSDHQMAHIGLSRIYSLKGDTDRADAHYTKAYAIGKEESSRLYAEAVRMRSLEKINDAVLLLEKALAKNPADTECYFELSSIERNRKNYKRAVGILQKLTYYRPHEERAWAHSANIYYSQRVLKNKRRDYTAAIHHIQKALEYNPDNLRYLEILEDCYEKTGQMKKYRDIHSQIEQRIINNEF